MSDDDPKPPPATLAYRSAGPSMPLPSAFLVVTAWVHFGLLTLGVLAFWLALLVEMLLQFYPATLALCGIAVLLTLLVIAWSQVVFDAVVRSKRTAAVLLSVALAILAIVAAMASALCFASRFSHLGATLLAALAVVEVVASRSAAAFAAALDGELSH